MLCSDTAKRWLTGVTAMIVLFSLQLHGDDQAKMKPEKVGRCAVSPVFTPDPDFPAIADWKPVAVNAPSAELVIRENGRVRDARLVRSSNVSAWDQSFLKTVKTWKFSKAPNCGPRRTTVSVDIHTR